MEFSDNVVSPINEHPEWICRRLASVPNLGLFDSYGVWVRFSDVDLDNMDENERSYLWSVAINMCSYRPCYVMSFIVDAMNAQLLHKGYWHCSGNVEFWNKLCAQLNKIMAPCEKSAKALYRAQERGAKNARVSASLLTEAPTESDNTPVAAAPEPDLVEERRAGEGDAKIDSSDASRGPAGSEGSAEGAPKESYGRAFRKAAALLRAAASKTPEAPPAASKKPEAPPAASKKPLKKAPSRAPTGGEKKAGRARSPKEHNKKQGPRASSWTIIKSSGRRRARPSPRKKKASRSPTNPLPPRGQRSDAGADASVVKTEHVRRDHSPAPVSAAPDPPSAASFKPVQERSAKARPAAAKCAPSKKEHGTIMYVANTPGGSRLKLHTTFVSLEGGEGAEEKAFVALYDKARVMQPSMSIVCIVIARRFHFFQHRPEAGGEDSGQRDLLINVKYEAEACAQKWKDYLSRSPDPLAPAAEPEGARHFRQSREEIEATDAREKRIWHDTYASIAVYILYKSLDLVHRANARALNSVVAFLSNEFSSHGMFHFQFRTNMFKLFMLRPGSQAIVTALLAWINVYPDAASGYRLKIMVQVMYAAKSILDLALKAPSGDRTNRLCAQSALSLLSCFGSLGRIVDYWTSTQDVRSPAEWSEIVALLRDCVLASDVQNNFFKLAQAIESKSNESGDTKAAPQKNAIACELIKRYTSASFGALVAVQLNDDGSGVLRAKLRARIQRMRRSRGASAGTHMAEEETTSAAVLMKEIILSLMRGDELAGVTIAPTRLGSLFVSWAAKIVRQKKKNQTMHLKTYAPLFERLVGAVANTLISFRAPGAAIDIPRSSDVFAKQCAVIRRACLNYIRGPKVPHSRFDDVILKMYRATMGGRPPQAQSAPTSPKS